MSDSVSNDALEAMVTRNARISEQKNAMGDATVSLLGALTQKQTPEARIAHLKTLKNRESYRLERVTKLAAEQITAKTGILETIEEMEKQNPCMNGWKGKADIRISEIWKDEKRRAALFEEIRKYSDLEPGRFSNASTQKKRA